MPHFSYKAINQRGFEISGAVEAISVEAVQNLLIEQGLIPSDVTRKGRTPGDILAGMETWLATVTMKELILFTKQLRTMLIAGLSILNVLEILERQSQNPKLKKALASMKVEIREGLALHEAFSKHPGIFSPLYTSMIEAGESSGTLPNVLDRLVYILDHEHKIRSDIKAALQYPIIVMVALAIAFFVLLTFVIPRFVGVFTKANLVLPLPTLVCLYMYQFLQNYWHLLLGGLVFVILAFRYWSKTAQGQYARDSFILRLPLLGILFVKAAMSRFASIFSILQASGVSVLTALDILSGTIGNAAISRELSGLKGKIQEGKGVSTPLRSSRYFTPMVVDMVAVGEESGNLEEMLQVIANHYDDEVEYAVKGLSEAIGPILIICLAAVVGFFALAIFLPMWDLTKMVG
ncbi:MAG: type II secretion system F family protein [Deltaproteobacteria bacterium]|nr:type II secretion system F family protein [Deltaproteobacteria bacterium]MBW2672416.1 type II secretion system F family protein [Deltaproteobacteria bacterium]